MSDYEIVRYLVENPTVEWEEACRLVGKTPPKLRARKCVLLPETWAGHRSNSNDYAGQKRGSLINSSINKGAGFRGGD